MRIKSVADMEEAAKLGGQFLRVNLRCLPQRAFLRIMAGKGGYP